MKLIYVKTTEITLDSFLKFCFNKLSVTYENKLDDFHRLWKFNLKQKYRIAFENSDYVILNNKGVYIGCLDALKTEVRKGLPIWNIEDIDLIKPYEEEYFEFDGYEKFLQNDKFFINKIGFDRNEEWIYMEIENKDTNYREFLINLKSFTNINKYIRQEKIRRVLDI